MQVHREPGGASRRPVFLRRPETRPWVAARRAVVRASWRCLRAHRRQRGDCGEGARRLLVRAESGDRNGSPDATAHGNTGHPRGYCQRRHTRTDRRREPGSRSATPGPGSQPFHRCPRRADLDRRRPGREPLHRHERRVPGMLGIKGDPAPGVRGDAAQGRAGDHEYRRHDGPRSGEYAVLQPHRVEPEGFQNHVTLSDLQRRGWGRWQSCCPAILVDQPAQDPLPSYSRHCHVD